MLDSKVLNFIIFRRILDDINKKKKYIENKRKNNNFKCLKQE